MTVNLKSLRGVKVLSPVGPPVKTGSITDVQEMITCDGR